MNKQKVFVNKQKVFVTFFTQTLTQNQLQKNLKEKQHFF